MINFFKKKLPAKSLAVMLMQYTILGNLTDDATAFALGPHSIETTDGSDVLPEDVERTNLNQLSSRDSLIIALETMYLRGFVAAFLLDRYVKNKSIRQAVLSSYNDYWRRFVRKGSLDYQNLFERSCQMYDSRMLISELEKSETPKDIGSEFANMCDPFEIIRNPLRSELAISGEAVFINAVEVVSNILEAALEKYKLTID